MNMFNFIYIAYIHGKWKPGGCEHVKPRFKTYNKGNFKFLPSVLYVVEEGHEEQGGILESKVKTNLYAFLENPEFHNSPTEYVNPKFEHINDTYIKDVMEKIILENNLSFRRIKEEFLKESVKDGKFLDKVRLFPDKYLEEIA